MRVNPLRSLFITGVGGFIGLAIAERALARGISVTGIDQSPAAVERARCAGAEAHVADITDTAALARLVPRVDVVVHTAAIVREYGELDEFRRVNVHGSVSVARAAQDAGVPTFVQLSSVMVYGFRYVPDVQEDGELRGDGNAYCQTKIESEAAVLALEEPGRFGVVVIRPGDVYGPGSVPWVSRPLAMMKKKRFFLPAGGKGLINHVYVEDLVDGIFLAAEARAYGEAFNLTDGRATSCAHYFGALARTAGLAPPRALPTPILMAAARGVARLHALGLTKDEAAVDTVRYLTRMNAVSIAKARARLGYAPRVSLEEGLARTKPFIDEMFGSARR